MRLLTLLLMSVLCCLALACEEPCGDEACGAGSRCGLSQSNNPACVVVECVADADCADDRVCNAQGTEDDPTICGAVCDEPAALGEDCEVRGDRLCPFTRRCQRGAQCSENFQSEDPESTFAVCERVP